MTKNYQDAVELAQTYFEHSPEASQDVLEALVVLGYRAGLKDASRGVQEAGAAIPTTDGVRRMYAIVNDKIAKAYRQVNSSVKERGILV